MFCSWSFPRRRNEAPEELAGCAQVLAYSTASAPVVIGLGQAHTIVATCESHNSLSRAASFVEAVFPLAIYTAVPTGTTRKLIRLLQGRKSITRLL